MSGVSYIEQADALLERLKGEKDVPADLQSHVAVYQSKRDAEDERASVAWARAIVRLGAQAGFTAEVERSAADLKAEIKSRNEGRDEADLIKPDGQSKVAMQAALDADDARQ